MSKRVKVLEMLPSLNYGGSQTMIVNLCSAMGRDEVQYDFIIDHEGMMAMAPIVESLGAKIYVMPTFKGTNLKEITDAWNAFFDEHPEYSIIHSHSRSYASIYLEIAKKHGLKTIIHSHNTSNGKGFGSMVKSILQLPLRRIADYFFACSREAGEWLFGSRIVEGDRFYVINNSVDTDRFGYDEKKREEYRTLFNLADEKVFIQIGRMAKQKNYLFTLDVFAGYLKKDETAKLFIVGDGEMEKEIRDRIKELKIEDSVVILQHRHDVESLLQMADVFLMPSLYEGLSVAAIEAQTSGIEVLCSDQVDRNVNVTGLCEFLPLEKEIWIARMSEKIKERRSWKKEVTSAGFDVRTNAEWLKEFYKRIV